MRKVHDRGSGSCAGDRSNKGAWLALAVAPAVVGLMSRAAWAATDTWTGATDTEWLTPGNWTGGNAPPIAGDTLVFSSTGTLNSDHNLGDGFSLGGLQFTTAAGAYNLTSGSGANNQSIALTGALVDNAASNTQTINFAINGTAASSLQLGSDKSAGNSLALRANATFGSMTVGTSTTAASTADTLDIGSTTLNVNGAVTMGVAATASDSNTALNVIGSGTWNVTSSTNTNFKVGIGSGNNTLAGNAITTLDMSGLANFTFSTGTGSMLLGALATRPDVTVKLANTSNIITAATVSVGDSGQVSGGDNNNNKNANNFLSLGAGTNVFNANTLTLGQTKSAGVMNYQTAAGSVVIRGEAGGLSTTNITVGRATGGTNGALTSGLLLANNNLSNATVQAGTVNVGASAGNTAGTSNGQVTFDTGTFSCTSLSLGVVSGTAAFGGAGGGNGTFTLGTNSSSTGVLNVASAFTLAGDTDTNGTNAGTSTGTFVINGGTANINANIAVTSTSIVSNTVATLTLNGGTLNMNGFAIGNNLPGGVPGSVTVNLPGAGQSATIQNLGGAGITAGNGTGATNGGVVMGGAGTLILAGTNNSYSGPTTVNSGVLQIGSGALGGSVPSGTTFTNNAVVNFDGSGSFTITPGISGSGTVNQNGTGTTTLAGANSYGGNTTINGGVLAVTGSISGNVAVNGGALAGTGTVGGVTLNSGGAIHPGTTGADLSMGTLSVTSLSVGGGDLRFDIGGSTSDLISDSGSASFTGGTVSIALDSAPTLTSYTLLTAGGGLSGSPTLSTTSIGRTNFSLSTVGNSLKLNVSGGPATLTWNHVGGTGDGHTWNNLQNNQNWSKSGSPDTFFDADIVTFNDANGGNSAVTIATQVSPGSVTFANNSASYVFTGAGGIAGTTGLTMSGSGSVTFQTANSYAGNTNINAGTLILGSGGSIGSNNFNVGGGTVNVNSGGALGSANINVNAGSLSIASGGSLTNSSPTVTVAGGASMSIASGAVLPASFNLTDNGTVTLSGSTTIGTLGGTGVVNLNGGALTVGNGGTVANTLQNGVSPGGLTVGGATPLVLVGANTYTGNTTINAGGTLQIGNGGAIGSLAAASAISNAGTLVYNLNAPSAVTIGNAITNTGTLNFASAGNLNVTGAISGAGGIRQTGAGTTSLSGDLSGFTGTYTLGGGTLQFNYASPTLVPNPIGVVAGATSTIQNVGKLTMSGTESVGNTAGAITYNVSPATGALPSGTNADVELTGSINRTTGSDGIGIIKTGTGVLAISGTTDNASLGITVSGGTLLLNKTSATTIHAIGGGGLVVNSGGLAQITGTGGEQMYNAAGGVTMNNGGTFDLNGQSQGINNLTFGDAAGPGTITDNVPGTTSVLRVGTAVGSTNDAGTAATAIGRIIMTVGSGNLGAATGSTLELQNNGLAAQGGNHTLTAVGPGTVVLSGVADNAAVNVAVTAGTLVLNKTNTGTIHATSAVVGVSAGATLQLSGSGTDATYGGNDQIYDGFITGTTDYGVLGMNGMFDLNGQSEAFDKLTGTGSVINSQSGTPVTLTLGTNNGVGPAANEFAGTISGNIAVTKVDAATVPTVEVPLVLDGVNTYSGNTNVNGGIMTIAAGGSIASATITVASGATLNVNGQLASTATMNANGPVHFGGSTGAAVVNRAMGTLNIASGVSANITPSAFPFTPAVLKPTMLAFADSTATLDLTNNELVDNEALATVVGRVTSNQIFSTATGGALGTLSLSPTQTEVRFTLLGDSNLDGTVDVTDLGNLASSYGTTSGAKWVQGDTNYDGAVDVTDLGNLASNYGGHLASGPSAGGDAMVASSLATVVASGGAAVPEPTALGLLAIGAIGLMTRRRRKA